MRLVRLLMCFVLLQLSFLCSAESIKVAAAHWLEFSEPEGKGIYLNLLKHSFSEDQVIFDVGSFARAKRLFKNHKADILVGVYKNDKELLGDILYPKYYLDLEFPIVAIYNPRVTKLRHSEDFKQLTIGWFEEYAYDRYVPQHAQSYRFTNISKALALLESGKIDVVVDHVYNLDERQLKILDTVELAPRMPIWIVFHNTEKGLRLKSEFETTFAHFYYNNTLEKIFGKHYNHANFDSLFPEN